MHTIICLLIGIFIGYLICALMFLAKYEPLEMPLSEAKRSRKVG